MLFIKIFKKIKNVIISLWIKRSSDSIINFYRKKGCVIGDGCIAFDPKKLSIDITRPSLIEIGNDVLLHRNLSLITHDYSTRVLIKSYGLLLPSSGKITIGNNVWFGENCTVLKGVTIGDNCIIGYGSIVTRDIPSNSVAVGIPAKVISSLEEYIEKRKSAYVIESQKLACSIRKRFNREPTINDFKGEDCFVFVDSTNMHKYPMFNVRNMFSTQEDYDRWTKNHRAAFDCFDDYIRSTKKTNHESQN